jgi:hypothetical protein
MATVNLNEKQYKWIAIISFLIFGGLSSYLYFGRNSSKLNGIDTVDNSKLIKAYYDQSLKELKKQNKSLYDSVKKYSDVESAMQIKYKKTYIIDTVFIHDKTALPSTVVKYSYSNPIKNDSINYVLEIGSVKEPEWYKLKISIGDEFTIVNRKDGELNQTIVDTKNNAVVDVTPFHAKEKTSFWKRFTFGPQVGVYYGILNKKPDIGIGIGGSFNILKH